ncbi:hypothetical protein BBP40_000964 [Aspergillus hancockii]|nr:hypothetical protein BBP40_000964 [Aspergillus hancockii]
MPKGPNVPKLHGEDKSTHSQKTPYLQLQDDEERLLPNSFVRTEPGAVSIVPGNAGQRQKKSKVHITPFKPYNTLSGRSRDSGPVRERGKQGRRSDNQRNTGNTFLRPENGAEHEEQERPSKRRRRESHDKISGRIINISDDDIMEQIAPDSSSMAGYSSRLSPSESQFSGKMKSRDTGPKRHSHNEFRGVESNVRPPRTPKRVSQKVPRWSSDGDNEERFTMNAAQERRTLTSIVDSKSSKLDRSDQAPKHETFKSVDVHPPSIEGQSTSPTLQAQSVATNWRNRSDLRESSDELQGDATVEPLFTLPEKGRRKDTTRAISEAKMQPGDVGRLSSPSDIQHTIFTSSSQGRKHDKRKAAQATRGKSAIKIFNVTFIRFGASERRSNDAFQLHVETTDLTAILPWNGEKISLERITKVIQGERPSCKVRLKFSRKGGLDDEMDTEFSTVEEQETFCNLLQGRLRGLNMSLKIGDWLNKAFARKAEELQIKVNEPKHLNEDNQSPILQKSPEVVKRMKLSDSLQDDHGNTAGQKHSSGTAFTEHSKLPTTTTTTMGTSNTEDTQALSSSSKREEAVEIPVKNFDPQLLSNRATRSMSRRTSATVVCDDGAGDDDPQPKHEERGKKWHRPLVYPRFGKKKAEVDAQDRERLRDNEFLNDNLIGFYIRFLEDHLERTNKKVAKRVYFFNSYFFATLTNVKGRRNINYEGVQKWTRSVDVFGFDYIVVPINESAHWYVAIICNLPNLPGISGNTADDQGALNYDKDSSAAPDIEAQEVPETPEPVEELPAADEAKAGHVHDSVPVKDEITRQSFEDMSLSNKPGPKDSESETLPTEWPEQEENLLFHPARFSSSPITAQSSEKVSSEDTSAPVVSPRTVSKKKGKPAVKPAGIPGGAKDARRPVIITFDSLDLARSPTISNLRDYLYEEGKSKRGIEIDRTLIKGMKARAIPLQPNYSDCGLYLLAYVEKFVQNPDLFVRRLLQKEMKTEDDWPPLKSGLLRRRLRDFLDDLYDEQAQLGPGKTSEKKTMADNQPISYLLGPPAPISTPDKEKDVAQTSQVKKSPMVEINSQEPPPRKQGPVAGQSSPAAESASQESEEKGSRAQLVANGANNSYSKSVEVSVRGVAKKPDDDVVEVQVPDSQEHVREAGSPAKAARKQDKPSPSEPAVMGLVDDQDLVRVEHEAAERTTKPDQPTTHQTIEVQIIPSQRKNQRTAKQKPK